MALSTDLHNAAGKADRLEEKLDRVTQCARVLCRTLGYCYGEGGAAFIGPPTVPGFVDTETAVRQLLEALGDPNR